MRNSKRPRPSFGFTLLETMIALAILSTAIILLANGWSGSFVRLQKTERTFDASLLLERKMTEVQQLYFGKPLDSIPEKTEEDFGSDYPTFSWRLESRKMDFPDMSSVLTLAAGGATQSLLSVVNQITDTLNKSVKEVKVTVVFKTVPQNIEYSATTYFVDYDYEPKFGVPGGG